ncbi:arginine-tRNA-protein transferase [Kockovaella imperatae]|uniref:arginyltransferase n=1 Tax=Kockovaella imperatae TaxID=4999 RepID=A0A1Y1U784_9TREE|nr:arginine-tRNA-protein transferase [Kockovaella imperatae]ORX33890.1 arginine-tRNA-protein transferase [Kockovaella imperatae]
MATISPDMGRTCCPQYTIRLDAQAFKPSKKQRQVINRMNRYLSGTKAGDKLPESELRAFESGYGRDGGAHRLETRLIPAKASRETFALYKKYQVAVHHDRPESVSMNGFRRFLCDSPLIPSDIPYESDAPGLPSSYGSYHLLYLVDSVLIGISVIDILPSCVSSVYFIWNPDWAWASLGKWSAMREVALARDIQAAGATDMKWVYMGYWIADCQKMRYKSEYSPSYLMDPATFVFHPLTSELDAFLQAHPHGYHPFEERPKSQPLLPALASSEFPSPAPVGFAEPETISVDDLIILLSGRAVLVEDVPWVKPDEIKTALRELVAAVGVNRMATPGRPGAVISFS